MLESMNMTDIHRLADEAANHAIAYIQDQIGQKSGDVAGLHFSGDRWNFLTNILSDYIQTEIMYSKGE